MTRDDFATLPELRLLAALVAGEALDQSYIGKLSVAYSVVNRVASPGAWITWWGRNVREVILCPKQYSCFDDPNRYDDMVLAANTPVPTFHYIGSYAESVMAAYVALNGNEPDPTHGATHYYAPKAMRPAGKVPSWVPHMRQVAAIDDQLFYVA